jgi:hypothetical protein
MARAVCRSEESRFHRLEILQLSPDGCLGHFKRMAVRRIGGQLNRCAASNKQLPTLCRQRSICPWCTLGTIADSLFSVWRSCIYAVLVTRRGLLGQKRCVCRQKNFTFLLNSNKEKFNGHQSQNRIGRKERKGGKKRKEKVPIISGFQGVTAPEPRRKLRCQISSCRNATQWTLSCALGSCLYRSQEEKWTGRKRCLKGMDSLNPPKLDLSCQAYLKVWTWGMVGQKGISLRETQLGSPTHFFANCLLKSVSWLFRNLHKVRGKGLNGANREVEGNTVQVS